MLKKIFLFAAIAILLSACAISPGIELLKRGQAAYEMQDYHTAFKLLLASAQNNNLTAEYAVGYMYYYGIGTNRDPYLAVMWFQKAAHHHQPDAMRALYLINHSGPSPFTFGKKKSSSGM